MIAKTVIVEGKEIYLEVYGRRRKKKQHYKMIIGIQVVSAYACSGKVGKCKKNNPKLKQLKTFSSCIFHMAY